MPATMIYRDDLTAAQRAMLDAITRVPADDSRPKRLTREERKAQERLSKAAYIAMDRLEAACPDAFREVLDQLLELELVVLWDKRTQGVFVCLTPWGMCVADVALAECRSRETVPVQVKDTSPPRVELQEKFVRVPYWVRPNSSALRRKPRQPKHDKEQCLPWPEEVPDHRKGPVEQLIDAETEKPVILCGVPVFIDQRLAKKPKPKAKPKGRRSA